MKELIYRNITGHNPRKREISIEKKSDRPDQKMIKKWTCKYYLKKSAMYKNTMNLERWVSYDQRKSIMNRCHLMRYIGENGPKKLVLKILGEFYVIDGLRVYKIFYMNKLRIEMI